MKRVGAVILAAGKGTRMRSRFPKMTHRVGGRAMLEHVLRAASDAVVTPEGVESPDAEDHSPRFVVVVGHEREYVRSTVTWEPPAGTVSYVIQEPQLGTGDAVRCAASAWAGAAPPDTILVLYGDTPLIRAETLRTLLAAHQQSGAVLSFLTGQADRPNDYGRVLRDATGQVAGIVEKRHATPDQLAITEVNSGIYCFESAWLWPHLELLQPHDNDEFYLTDLVGMAVQEGQPTTTTTVELEETIGVNDRVQLAEAERILRGRILRELMLAGVTIEDPATTYVEASVRVGQDTLLRPGTMLYGTTVIGAGCEIGPNSVVRDSTIGDDCVVLASWLEGATMEPGSRIGPMSRLRRGARLRSGAHMGNFAEVKNATIGQNVQMHHFSYIGDADIGAGTNIGAGTITCNYDGTQKHHTEVGERVFLGSDTLLVAPVTVGDGASTGAGAVVTRDVPPGKLVAGVPARVIRPVRRADASAGSAPAEPDSGQRQGSSPEPSSGHESAGHGERE
jgi:bifunctional UDP-N-acetylglucosamine pyrophosphorylase/glucosamine-1-phosphate N-acetyltransferase